MKDMSKFFPDGSPIDVWFEDHSIPALEDLGKQYVLADYGISDDGKVYTAEIQSLIDRAYDNGGGVIVVPEGKFMTGALFFKKNVHLYLEKNAVLMGSDNIADYPVIETRIEGETCKYFPALINADNADGFTVCGEGTVDGNGSRAWRAFWIRREWNPDCTNKDEQRPRLLYISKSNDVTVSGVTLQNSHYWTTHIYKCNRVRFLNCRITAPNGAPSTDAIDIDACTDVLVKGCYMAVSDDGVVLKGGKGPWADTDPNNGINERVIVEDCVYGHCHACLTCGSESVHSRNIIVRRVKLEETVRLLWLKFRPDTPQCYEYIRIEDAEGDCKLDFININPWRQFFDLKGRTDKPVSLGRHIEFHNCDCSTKVFFDVTENNDQYRLSDFVFDNVTVHAQESRFNADIINGCTVNGLNITLK